MFNIPAADDVAPRRRNHGLNPSDEPLCMIRKCYTIQTNRDVSFSAQTRKRFDLFTHLRDI